MWLKQELKARGIGVETFEASYSWEELKKNSDNLVPVVTQDYKTREVLMVAYMNREAYENTLSTGRMTYYSRSRQSLWLKGETSGHFQYVKEFIFDVTGSKIACEIRRDLFRHIQSLSAEFFDRTGTGELMSRVKDDVDRIWDGLSYVGMLMIEVIIHTSIILFCMYSLSWKLAVLPTLCMLLAAAIAILMEKKLDAVYEDISEENAALNTVAEENLAGARTVKAFAREKAQEFPIRVPPKAGGTAVREFLRRNKRSKPSALFALRQKAAHIIFPQRPPARSPPPPPACQSRQSPPDFPWSPPGHPASG